MITANIAELKNHLTEYLREVDKGSEVGICRRNVLVARISPVKTQLKKNRTRLGCGRGTARILGDLTEPLIPERDWEMLQDRGDDEGHP